MKTLGQKDGTFRQRFLVQGKSGATYELDEFVMDNPKSNEIHNDGMSRRTTRRFYYKLASGGGSVEIVRDEPDTFKIVETNEIVRKL